MAIENILTNDAYWRACETPGRESEDQYDFPDEDEDFDEPTDEATEDEE